MSAQLNWGGIMAVQQIRRFVLIGDYLEPDHIHILDPVLAAQKIYVEVRRTTGVPLPFEHIKDLASNTAHLIIDPFTSEHEEVIDCIMLGAKEVCIDAGAAPLEIELAYASSKYVLTRLWLESWPPDEERSKQHHYALILDLAESCGRKAVVTSARIGIAENWWKDLPNECRKAFDWYLAPAEGTPLGVDVQPSGWLIYRSLNK